MRTFGFILLVAGCIGFYYCSEQLSPLDPNPAGYSVEQALQTDRGKWEAGRYACAGGALIGLLFAFFPQGR
jgi:hypothetical protein